MVSSLFWQQLQTEGKLTPLSFNFSSVGTLSCIILQPSKDLLGGISDDQTFFETLLCTIYWRKEMITNLYFRTVRDLKPRLPSSLGLQTLRHATITTFLFSVSPLHMKFLVQGLKLEGSASSYFVLQRLQVELCRL